MTITELINQMNISTKTVKCAVYKADGNGVYTKAKELYSFSELYNNPDFEGLYIEVTEENNGFYTLTFWDDCKPCNTIGQCGDDKEVERLKDLLLKYIQNGKGYDRLVKVVESCINDGCFIGNTYIYIIAEHKDFELMQKARQVKAEYLAEQERQREEERTQRAAEEKAREQKEQEEKERIRREKLAFLEGYGEGKTQIQIERLYDILHKTQGYRENDKVIYKTRKQFILDELNEGGRAEKKEGVISYYGSKWNVKQSKPKTEYRLYSSEGSFWTITKTEYDFALYLMQKMA